MKVCPVCQAKAFDDAEVCYGCLHRFEESQPERIVQSALDTQCAAAPEFCIRLKPSSQESGEVTWRCSVELCK